MSTRSKNKQSHHIWNQNSQGIHYNEWESNFQVSESTVLLEQLLTGMIPHRNVQLLMEWVRTQVVAHRKCPEKNSMNHWSTMKLPCYVLLVNYASPRNYISLNLWTITRTNTKRNLYIKDCVFESGNWDKSLNHIVSACSAQIEQPPEHKQNAIFTLKIAFSSLWTTSTHTHMPSVVTKKKHFSRY
jgi:hypothetical protein